MEARSSPPSGKGSGRCASDLGVEIRVVSTEPDIRRPLAAVWAHRFLLGGGFIVLVLVADSRYSLEAPGYGIALAATGVGAVAGTVGAPLLARRFEPVHLLPLAFFVAGGAAVIAGFWANLPALTAALGVTALAFQVLKVSADALVQLAAGDWVRGRVFAAYDVLYNVAFVAAALAMIPLWVPGRENLLLYGLAVAFPAAGLLLARDQRAGPLCGTRAIARDRRPTCGSDTGGR